jgi:hypothetical protein
MKELARGVDGKRRRLLLMEGAEAGEVLRSGFFQLYVVAYNANDVRLLLDGICEITWVGHVEVFNIVLEKSFLGNAKPLVQFRQTITSDAIPPLRHPVAAEELCNSA